MGRNTHSICWLLPIVLASGLAGSARMQEPPAIRVGVDLVRVSATVTNARGDFIPNLRKEDFQIFDDGTEVAIDFFAATEEPARVLVLVETGPAVYLISQQHLAAAQLLFAGLAADDEVALASYSNTPTLQLDFTQDKRAALNALITPQFSLGSADLRLTASLSPLLEWLASAPGKKSIVLLSTGLDANDAAQEQLRRQLRSTEVSIYAVALGGSLRKQPSSKKTALNEHAAYVTEGFARADTRLREFAELTGGRAFFPADESELKRAYQQIAGALRHQYRLGFPAPHRDGRSHMIEVRLRHHAPSNARPHRVYARKGYVAPG